MRTHCPVCGWVFSSESAVGRHLAMHHRGTEHELALRPPAVSAGTEHGLLPHPPDAPPPPPWVDAQVSGPGRLEVGVSYAAAVLFPVVGLVMGIWLLARHRSGHGIAVILITIVVGIALTAILR